jgi:high-affinity iron transporter
MARNLFSVPIFFIVFRETLEAAIIISTLLGLVEQIVYSNFHQLAGATPPPEEEDKKEAGDISLREVSDVDDGTRKRRLLRKMRFQECSTLHLRILHVTEAMI